MCLRGGRQRHSSFLDRGDDLLDIRTGRNSIDIDIGRDLGLIPPRQARAPGGHIIFPFHEVFHSSSLPAIRPDELFFAPCVRSSESRLHPYASSTSPSPSPPPSRSCSVCTVHAVLALQRTSHQCLHDKTPQASCAFPSYTCRHPSPLNPPSPGRHMVVSARSSPSSAARAARGRLHDESSPRLCACALRTRCCCASSLGRRRAFTVFLLHEERSEEGLRGKARLAG
ncbi:hypothetical protein DFH06DRAFT_1481762 [Mycena polygramma]|nr:hypothetical protein DFH06DRAFT_1481762 [Mycena polygramma]